MGTIKVKRIYEPADRGDGTRILVDQFHSSQLSPVSSHLSLYFVTIFYFRRFIVDN
jgi:uncharacterized protein YeaO (DUF488 family)